MADANMSYVYTVGGYAALFGVGYAVYHVSTQKNKKRVVPTPAKTSKASQLEPRKEDRKKKQRLESFTSEARPKASESSSWPANAPIDDTPDKEPDNREFARQLAKAKEGTKFASKGDNSSQREKSVKQSRANKMGDSAENKSAAKAADSKVADTEPVETKPVEAPAKVEKSPSPSPEMRPVDSTGVSDMLEPEASKGPSVLRVTDNGSKKQDKKAAKAPEPVETKKQRQNRKKAEAAKAARQEAETDRKGLEEKQRRQARIAEGRAAKDGSQYKAANGTSSSWTQGAPNGNTPKAANADVLHQPLDTFEKPAAPAVKQTKGVKSDGTWMASVPSEESQIDMIKDDADDWSTVKTKASKKTSKKSSSGDSGDEPSQSRAAAQPKQAAEVKKPASRPAAAQNFGSFSALTTKNAVEDDVEEEWDV